MDTQHITQNLNTGQTAVKQLPSGTVLVDRYSVQEVIGIGGMGSVYRARDLHFPNVVKLVAVKEMINQAPDPLVRKTIVQNFEREANILVALAHPSIPKIYDYFSYDERSYLVEEYINGKDIEAILSEAQGFFPEDRVIGWAIELCDVIQYLHSHKPEPIIFRDMKPSNVMINSHNHIILVDFGIAKVFKHGQKGTMIGTEGYSPPEQYRGEASPQADIYSLGATLHHILTRKDPRLEAPFSFSERPIRQINPSVSPELEAIVNTALQYNPQDRFSSIEVLKEALIAAAKKTGALNRLSINPAPIVNDHAIKPLWEFECEDEVRGSPCIDAGIIYVGAYDNNLYALNATDGKFLWKFPTEGGIVTKPIVNDGAVIFGSEDHRLYAVSTRTGKQIWAFQTDAPIRSSPSIAEGHVFFGSDDGYLYAVNLVSNRLVWRLDAGAAIRSSPAVLDGYIYFGSDTGEFICSDFRGQAKWRFKAKRNIISSPIIKQGVVYFTSLDSTFYALDAKSGWVIWRFRMGKGSVSSPCRMEEIVIAGSADGYLYAVDAANSKEIWRFKTEHQVSGSPVGTKDSIYCGSADGSFYCLEYKSGRLRWQYLTGGAITGNPAVTDDVVIIGSADHKVYSFLA
ncbi:MAG: PQQ-binding-like beta-propeller repeat protein [Anaerolineaceae bacterium]|nr:PQQ-binding-like beta-propeller repeat protein [Anaerolineaceae bacterium]